MFQKPKYFQCFTSFSMNSTGTVVDSSLDKKFRVFISAQALPVDVTEIHFWRDIF